MIYDIAAEEGLGDVYTIEEFAESVKIGAFIPDDGCGMFGTEDHYSYSANVWTATKLPAGATHVHWFNK